MKKYQVYCCLGLLLFIILSGWIGVGFYIEYQRLMVMSTVKAPVRWALEDIENDMSQQKYADAYMKIKILNRKWEKYSSTRELGSCDFGDIPMTMTERSCSDSP